MTMLRSIFAFLLMIFVAGQASAQTKPERVIMLYIDGLHPDAIDRFELRTLAAMRTRGASAREGVMPFPAHPTIGAYGDWHTTSFPNVMALAGTAFLSERPVYLQHSFVNDGITLHAAGSRSYRSLNDGFDYTLTRGNVTDTALVDFYIKTFEHEGDVLFARIMLQETGNAGRLQSAQNLSNDPWSQDVFAPNSPYGVALRNADRQIERLREFLSSRGELDSTLFVLMGDGQSPHGWHLDLDPESARTPIVFDGPGIRTATEIDYAETIDVAPTIAALMGVRAPNSDGGSGRVLTSLITNGMSLTHPRPISRINVQIREHARLWARAVLAAAEDLAMNVLLMHLKHELLSDHQFYGPSRVMEWSEAGSLDDMIAANAWVNDALREALDRCVFPFATDKNH
ncbi:sulfatase-like hydrolase/transferase [Denitrobaculum tricleocarpae]|uniref:Alkaline phosphatase family protein n=1 Tax=Denitrobaculum tricleocarpae TaxID=2591009 RepID=A0A545TQ70_9PROT|nr:sulfatase-like hydrolase/transferase [Denitrobaculum tricleocarpae]TQV79369.1 alkaline phosphatase family protein [Denitrobaculum tricleocarpae]